MNKTFIFDYDDTLAPNEYCYSFAELKLIEWIMNKFGPRTPKPYEIGNLEVAIDKEAVNTMGFSMQRFPTTCKETYRRICETKGVIPTEQDLQTAYNIGLQAFDEKLYEQTGLFEGVVETLDFLLQQKDELLLLSKGDKEIQGKKFKATNIRRWFEDKIYVCLSKTEKEIQNVCGTRCKDTVYLVGNSAKSDVKPALKTGINVIYIPLETWAWETDHEPLPEEPHLKTINKIIKIKEKYEVLTR